MTKVRTAFAITMGMVVLVQIVPYGRNHTNPSVRTEPSWNVQETRALAQRACFDCHSNETKWPWYSTIAPVSWLVQRDVEEGRRGLNFSEWGRPHTEANEAASSVEKGEMPLRFYVAVHPQARLEPTEREALIRGLQATVAGSNGHNAAEDHDRQAVDRRR